MVLKQFADGGFVSTLAGGDQFAVRDSLACLR